MCRGCEKNKKSRHARLVSTLFAGHSLQQRSIHQQRTKTDQIARFGQESAHLRKS
jgi:hypothetical protein